MLVFAHGGLAEGQAAAIQAVAIATAEGLRQVASALREPGGSEAMQLRIAEEYVSEFGQLAKAGNTLIVPANLADISSMIALATNIGRGNGTRDPVRPERRPES